MSFSRSTKIRDSLTDDTTLISSRTSVSSSVMSSTKISSSVIDDSSSSRSMRLTSQTSLGSDDDFSSLVGRRFSRDAEDSALALASRLTSSSDVSSSRVSAEESYKYSKTEASSTYIEEDDKTSLSMRAAKTAVSYTKDESGLTSSSLMASSKTSKSVSESSTTEKSDLSSTSISTSETETSSITSE